MKMRHIEEFDLTKLREAKRLIEQVNNYYYCSVNSRDFCNRLRTLENKLDEVIKTAEDYNKNNIMWRYKDD